MSEIQKKKFVIAVEQFFDTLRFETEVEAETLNKAEKMVRHDPLAHMDAETLKKYHRILDAGLDPEYITTNQKASEYLLRKFQNSEWGRETKE